MIGNARLRKNQRESELWCGFFRYIVAMLNFRHLYYFWVVVKEGGFARAAQRLDMAVQTISAQVRELEKSLGHQLLRPAAAASR